MSGYHEQINRIKTKLPEAGKADRDCKVFGADRHKYFISSPASESEVRAFEERFSIQLPECYRSFILQVGNGGTGYCNSAAGPYYGIYPLGENADELISDNTEKYLKNPCIIYPEMTNEFWETLIKIPDKKEGNSDEDYEAKSGEIFAGILPVGSQGCTYLHGIVLNGPYKGRVVNLDLNRQKPHFACEKNFLDWYERWLDEVISGRLITHFPVWFGYSKGL